MNVAILKFKDLHSIIFKSVKISNLIPHKKVLWGVSYKKDEIPKNSGKKASTSNTIT